MARSFETRYLSPHLLLSSAASRVLPNVLPTQQHYSILRGGTMGVLIVDVEKDIDSAFRKKVEKKYGHGEQVVELVLNAVMKDWAEKQVVE